MKTFAVGLASLLALVGCGNGTTGNDAGGHHAATPTCDAILSRCHPLDTGLGEIHVCHELAESTAATAEADCMAMQTHCFAVCTPATDGGTADGGASDTGVDAAP